MHIKTLIFICFHVSTLLLAQGIKLDANKNNRKLLEACNYLEADVLYEEGRGERISFCKIDGQRYEIVGKISSRERLISGTSVLTILGGTIEGNKIIISDETEVLVDNSKVKVAATYTGSFTAVAIRVIASDASTSSTADEISDNIFGTSGDTFNMKSQFSACSYDQFTMDAFSGTTSSGQTITNGVGVVTINSDIIGADKYAVHDLVEAAADAKYGVLRNQVDFVLLCLPHGTITPVKNTDTWIGYGYYDSYLTVYNDEW